MTMMTTMSEVADEVSKRKEELMLAQLGDLVKKNLLIWEEGPRQFTQDPFSGDFKITVSGRFRLREEEYIKELEQENAQFRATLNLGERRPRGR